MILGLGSTSGVSLSNVTRPSASYFQPGDRYQIKVSGPPNSPVSVTVKLPSGDLSSTTYGSTDASGNFSMYGDIGVEHVGHWIETWHVGGQDVAPVLAFDVLKAPTAITPAPSETSPTETTPPVVQQDGTPFDLSTFVSDNKWLLIGGAAAVAFFMFGRGK